MDGSFALAIETSTRDGSLAIGYAGGDVIEHRPMPQPTNAAHRRVDLLPATADLCADHGVAPAAIVEVYISIGPGSFTGLRNAVTAAKMLTLVHGCKIIAVPTEQVVARLAPVDAGIVAVGISTRKDIMWSAVYERGRDESDTLAAINEPALRTPDELLADMPRPALIIGDHLPDYDWPADVTLMDGPAATPRADIVYALGQALAARGDFTDAWNLLPCYARPPEAVVLWKKNRR